MNSEFSEFSEIQSSLTQERTSLNYCSVSGDVAKELGQKVFDDGVMLLIFSLACLFLSRLASQSALSRVVHDDDSGARA